MMSLFSNSVSSSSDATSRRSFQLSVPPQRASMASWGDVYSGVTTGLVSLLLLGSRLSGAAATRLLKNDANCTALALAPAGAPSASSALLPAILPPPPMPPPPMASSAVPSAGNAPQLNVADVQTFHPATNSLNQFNLDNLAVVPALVGVFGPAQLPPVVPFSGDPTPYEQQPAVPGGFTYATAPFGSRLFGSSGVPVASDVRQGYFLGDCFFLASLQAAAKANPEQFAGNIITAGSLGDKVFYRVRFCDLNGDSVWVDVDNSFPVSNSNSGVPLGVVPQSDATSGNLIIWPALYEKAFAKFLDMRPDMAQYFGNPQGGGYNTIADGGNAALALQMVTCFGVVSTVPQQQFSKSEEDFGQSLVNYPNLPNAATLLSTYDHSALPNLGTYDFDTATTTFADGNTLRDMNGVWLRYTTTSNEVFDVVGDHTVVLTGGFTLPLAAGQDTYAVIENPWGFNFNDQGGSSGTANMNLPTSFFYNFCQQAAYQAT